MKSTTIRIAFFLVTTFLVTVACGLLPPTPASSVNPDVLYTQAAQTVVAQLTQAVIDRTATSTPPGLIPTTGAQVSETPTETATQFPPSPTPVPPSPTPLPPTPTPVPCNRAAFIADITIEDGTPFGPDARFTKIWRLRNDGACIWNSSYSLVFVDGKAMTGSNGFPLPGNVRPGETVDVAVDLQAPGASGTYRSDWMLRSPEGVLFGIGEKADRPFWVEIAVVSPPRPNSLYNYDLAANYCSATWRSNTGRLPCPGAENSEDGAVILLDRPDLEDGRQENELTLWTRPAEFQDGWISGTFPTYKVKAGDHFLADIGCLAGNKRCDLTFILDYLVEGQPVRNLGTWDEVYDGKITRIDIDLSSLSGQSVQFILSVVNAGKPANANGFWLVPSVRSGSALPPGGQENTPAAQAARQKLAANLGLDPLAISFKSVVAVEWSDSCLGVTIPEQLCAPAVVPGYRVILLANNRQYEAHTNSDGSIVYFFEL